MEFNLKKIFQSPNDGHYFFGYYDRSQLSKCCNYIISLKVNFIDRYPELNESASLVYFDIIKKKQFLIDKTFAFNYQNGCLASWIENKTKKKVIYNQFNNNQLISIIFDLYNKTKSNIELPVYQVSPNSKFFLTLNFYNLSKFKRGYGYDFSKHNFQKYYCDKNEVGIWMYILSENKYKKIFDLSSIKKNTSSYWIEHINISPNNYDFVFLVRHKLKDGGVMTEFYLSDIDKKKLIKLNNSGRFSHFNWASNNILCGYGGVQNLTNTFRKNSFIQNLKFLKKILKFYHKFVPHNSLISKSLTGDCYQIINTNNLKKKNINYKRINSDELNSEDGHPTLDLEKSLIITDFYSDLPAKQPCLIFFDLNKNTIIKKKFFNSIEKLDNSPFRCDLHPRKVPGKSIFSIDFFDNDKRAFIVYEYNYK